MLQSDPFGHMTLHDIANSVHMLKKLLIRTVKGTAKVLMLQGAAFQSEEVLLAGRTFSSVFLQGVENHCALCVCVRIIIMTSPKHYVIIFTSSCHMRMKEINLTNDLICARKVEPASPDTLLRRVWLARLG